MSSATSAGLRLTARRREMARGGFWGIGTMGIALIYSLLDQGPHHLAMVLIAACGCALSVSLGVAAGQVPGLVRVRRPVMIVYTVAHVALTVALAVADGGADSPMALGFFGTLTFTAYAMPLRLLPYFGVLNVGGYLLVYAIAGAARPGFVPVEIAGMLATAAACAQQHHRLVTQRRLLDEMARTDPLTGCLNRRGFDERLPALLDHDGVLPSLMVLDLDDFKAVNDRGGHAAGDDLLIKTTRVIRETLGDQVVVARLGGDEFAIILTSPPSEIELTRLVETLEHRTSASVGSVTVDRPGMDAGQLLAAADRELYRHKARRKLQPTGRDTPGPTATLLPPVRA